MGEKKDLKLALKSLLDQTTAIETEAAGKPMTEEQLTKYQGFIKQAQGIKAQLDGAAQKKALDEWSHEPNGDSAVKKSFEFNGEALPDEGNIAEIGVDYATGELVATGKRGEKSLSVLKSGEYKDAVREYIRTCNQMTGAMKGSAMKVLNEGVDTYGGFWLPPDFRNELVKKMPTITSVRANAMIYTTGTDKITFPASNWTTDDKYTTGGRFSWQQSTPLSSPITEATNPVAGQINIPVHSAVLAINLTREQVEDSVFDVLGYITQIATEAYGLGEEDAFTNGTGAGQPWGFLSNTNFVAAQTLTGVSQKVAWQGAVGSEDPTKGILGAEMVLAPQYENGSKWYASKNTYSQVRSLVDVNKRPMWIQTDGGYQQWVLGYPATLIGYPIVKNQFMPSIGAGSPIIMALGDMKGYYIVDRVGLSIEVLREIRALYGEVVVYCRKRVGGQLVKDFMLKALACTA